jgi:2-polyprenyl-3-methyl-5-hydroxy-6-metoxy-1,4-benzoquinol methylase
MSKATVEPENLWGYAKRLRFVRQAIRDRFPSQPADELRVLDIGCGNGSQLALPLAKDGYNLTGIDTDEASIRHARKLSGDLPNARFLGTTLDDFDDPTEFEVVILSEVLEHLERPEQLLTAAAGRMTPNGLMIVTVPNGYGEFEWDSWVFRGLRLQKLIDRVYGKGAAILGATDNHASGHIQFFIRADLDEMFAAAGLELVRDGSGSLACGPIAGHTLGRSARFIEWNARITERLPPELASSWYFALTFPPSRGPA